MKKFINLKKKILVEKMVQIKQSKLRMFDIMRSNEIIDSSKTNRFKSQNEINYNPNIYANFPIKFEYPNINYAEDEKRKVFII